MTSEEKVARILPPRRRSTGKRRGSAPLLRVFGVGAVVALVVTVGVVVNDDDGDDRAQATPSVPPPAAATPTQPVETPPLHAAGGSPAVTDRDPAAELTAALDRTLGDRSDDVSAFAVDLATGKTVAYGRDGGMATASMVKLDILLTLLMQKQDAGTVPTASERATAGAMIRESDNDAATNLWNEVGQGAGVSATNARLGLTATTPGESSYWGSTESSARDQVRLMSSLYSPTGPLKDAYRSFALDLLTHVDDDQSWGVSSADDSGAPALKNGWLPRERDGGRWIVTSVGHVTAAGRELVLAVLTRRSATMPAGIDVVEDVAERLRTTLAEETRAS